jgi:hypothetical protein
VAAARSAHDDGTTMAPPLIGEPPQRGRCMTMYGSEADRTAGSGLVRPARHRGVRRAASTPRFCFTLLIGPLNVTPNVEERRRGYAFEGLMALDRLLSGVVELPTKWRPQRDSNPRFGLERATSWASGRWGLGGLDEQAEQPMIAGRRTAAKSPRRPLQSAAAEAVRC